MEILRTLIPDCFELVAPVHRDTRGRFTKIFRDDVFAKHGLATRFSEEYFTLSHAGVLRGMHFQTPPHDHVKFVYCAAGRVLDALLDLRIGSPAYGKHAVFQLDAERGNALYIAPGIAHGFYVPEADAVMVYQVTTLHAPQNDAGVRWNSAGIDWPLVAEPILSERDRNFPPLSEYVSPFKFQERCGRDVQ